MRWLGVVVYHESSYAYLPGVSYITRTEGEVCSRDFDRGDFDVVEAASFSDNASHEDDAIELAKKMVVDEGMDRVVVLAHVMREWEEVACIVPDGEGGCRDII